MLAFYLFSQGEKVVFGFEVFESNVTTILFLEIRKHEGNFIAIFFFARPLKVSFL